MATVGESKEHQTKEHRPPRDFVTISPPKTSRHWAYTLPLFYMTNHSHLNSSNLSLKCESSTSLYLYRCYQPTGQAAWFHHAVKKTFNPRIYYTWIHSKSPNPAKPGLWNHMWGSQRAMGATTDKIPRPPRDLDTTLQPNLKTLSIWADVGTTRTWFPTATRPT